MNEWIIYLYLTRCHCSTVDKDLDWPSHSSDFAAKASRPWHRRHQAARKTHHLSLSEQRDSLSISTSPPTPSHLAPTSLIRWFLASNGALFQPLSQARRTGVSSICVMICSPSLILCGYGEIIEGKPERVEIQSPRQIKLRKQGKPDSSRLLYKRSSEAARRC